MGGLGSGRSSGGGKVTAEACRSIDVNRLRREGVLSAGWSGGWEWKRNGERVSSISMRGGEDRIVLSYRSRIGSEEWQDVAEPIPIRWVPCRYGGQRPYFVCPGIVNGVACRRNVIKLYCAGRYYLCRHCYRLTHASRNEDSCDRALRRANKIRMGLGGEPGYEAMIPRRPKGMWRKTYDRLFEAVIESESRAEERLTRMAATLLDLDQRLETNTRKPKRRYW
jgi:hypothetical protein